MFEIVEELPPIVAKWVATYEQEHGKQPAKQVLRIVVYFERLGQALRDLGCNDAKIGRKPLPFSVFNDLTRFVIADRTDVADECVQIYAELMQDKYMAGYAGKLL